MYETLGIVASVIAIVGALLAAKKWLRPKEAVDSESFKRALVNLESYYVPWKEAGYPAKHKHLIPPEEFREIGRHRAKILSMSDANMRVFLLVSATKNGVWGEWWPRDVETRQIIGGLVTLLNGLAGWRPIWRAAYLLERLSDGVGFDWTTNLPRDLQVDTTVQQAVSVIRHRQVVKHLEEVSVGTDVYLRDKAFTILEDIKAYHGEEVLLRYPTPQST